MSYADLDKALAELAAPGLQVEPCADKVIAWAQAVAAWEDGEFLRMIVSPERLAHQGPVVVVRGPHRQLVGLADPEAGRPGRYVTLLVEAEPYPAGLRWWEPMAPPRRY